MPKYLMWRTFAIPSNDDPDKTTSDETIAKEKASKKKTEKYEPPINEPDFEALEKATEKHRKEKIGTVEAIALDKRLENHGIDKLKFLSTYEVSSLEEMTNGDWDKANTAIKQKYEK